MDGWADEQTGRRSDRQMERRTDKETDYCKSIVNGQTEYSKAMVNRQTESKLKNNVQAKKFLVSQIIVVEIMFPASLDYEESVDTVAKLKNCTMAFFQ